MNGPEHYREAERMLERANDSTTYDEAAGMTLQAQVHATLALAAAQAGMTLGMPGNPSTEWSRLIGPRPTITNHPHSCAECARIANEKGHAHRDDSPRALLDECTARVGCTAPAHIGRCPEIVR